jgi:hypothetical protein
VVGTWKNKASKAADELTLQQLENKALLAQLTYNEALLAYQSDAVSLQNDIQDWKLRVARQKNLAEYHKQVLAQKQSLLEKGWGDRQTSTTRRSISIRMHMTWTCCYWKD